MAEFAAMWVRPAGCSQLRQGRYLPGHEVWLVDEHRSSGELKCYLSNLTDDTPHEELAASIKDRLVGLLPDPPPETDRSLLRSMDLRAAHQQLKEEPGLGHFEGRSLSRSSDLDTCGDGSAACWPPMDRPASPCPWP